MVGLIRYQHSALYSSAYSKFSRSNPAERFNGTEIAIDGS